MLVTLSIPSRYITSSFFFLFKTLTCVAYLAIRLQYVGQLLLIHLVTVYVHSLFSVPHFVNFFFSLCSVSPDCRACAFLAPEGYGCFFVFFFGWVSLEGTCVSVMNRPSPRSLVVVVVIVDWFRDGWRECVCYETTLEMFVWQLSLFPPLYGVCLPQSLVVVVYS